MFLELFKSRKNLLDQLAFASWVLLGPDQKWVDRHYRQPKRKQKRFCSKPRSICSKQVTRYEPCDFFSLYQQFEDNFCHYRQQFDASFPGVILQSGRELWIGWRVAASLMQLTAIVTANNTNNTSPVCLSTVNCFLFSNCVWLCAVC